MITLLMAASRPGHGASGTALVADDQRYDRDGRMGDYALATDDAARTLSREERAHLRATGMVPDWFIADVERRFTELRRR